MQSSCSLHHSFFSTLVLQQILWIVVASTLSSAQPCPVTWGSTVQLSNTPSSAFVPKLAVVGDTVHVVYRAGSLYYRRSTDAGLTWSSQHVVVPSESLPGQIWNRPFTASGRNLYFVWGNSSASGTITSMKIRRSTDGGETWLEPQVLVRNDLQRYEGPMVAAIDSMAYVVFVRSVSGRYQWFLTRSLTYGASWDSIRQLTFSMLSSSLGPYGDFCARTRAIHLAYERNVTPSGREIGYTRSTDNGLSWGTEEILSTIDNYQAWEPNVGVDDAGNTYVSWQDAKHGSTGYGGCLLVRRSTNGGLAWEGETRINTNPSAVRSTLTVSRDNVLVAWEDERLGSFNYRVYYSVSTNAGSTWCGEYQVADSTQESLNVTLAAWNDRVHAAYSYRVGGGNAQVMYRQGKGLSAFLSDPIQGYPFQTRLFSNYPNPFNNRTIITFELAVNANTRLILYDVQGREVRSLLNEFCSIGRHEIVVNAEGLSTGMYYLLLQTAGRKEVREILLLK